jgi:glycosyltransferase involved in cell wall biosynthesis
MEKRILVMTHAGGSPIQGPNMRWYYLAKALHRHGVRVDIAASSQFHKYLAPPNVVSPIEEHSIDDVQYYWVKTKRYRGRGLGQVWNQIQFTRNAFQLAVQNSLKGTDFVVASSPHPLVIHPAIFVARRLGAQLIFESRDLWPKVLIDLGVLSPRHPYALALQHAESRAVRNSEAVITVKEGESQYYVEKYGLDASRITYVPNGFFPDDRSGPLTTELRGLRAHYRFIVGYVGAISSYYQLDRLLDVAQNFRSDPSIGFVVIGSGSSLDQLRTRAEAEDLHAVHFLGSLPKSKAQAALSVFDACYVSLANVDAHKYGVSANKIYEYMEAKRPILAHIATPYDPISRSGCGFVSTDGDPSPIVEGIRQLRERDGLAERMGTNARAYFEENHDFRSVAKRFLALLDLLKCRT